MAGCNDGSRLDRQAVWQQSSISHTKRREGHAVNFGSTDKYRNHDAGVLFEVLENRESERGYFWRRNRTTYSSYSTIAISVAQHS